MADISIKMVNEKRIVSAFKRFPGEMGKIIAETVRQSAVFLTGKVKEHIASGTDMWKAPLDTGAMRQGIHPVFDSMKAYIRPSTITPYATYVHEGTSGMRARPFFEITADREQKSVSQFAIAQIEKAIKRILP